MPHTETCTCSKCKTRKAAEWLQQLILQPLTEKSNARETDKPNAHDNKKLKDIK